jgi:hypothetical protein
MPDTLTQVLSLLEKSPDVNSQAARQMLKEANLIELPCKIGDTIYNTKGETLKVERISITEYVNIYAHTEKFFPNGECNSRWVDYEIKPKAFGKTVFLTEQEAIKALEGGDS